MKTTCYIILCLVIMVASCTNETQEGPQECFDYGTIENDLYTNLFFGFQISIPEDYLATYKRYDFHQKSLFEKDTVDLVPRPASSIITAQLLYLEPPLEEIGMDQAFNFSKTSSSLFKTKKNDSVKRSFFGADYQININTFKLPYNDGFTYDQIFYNMRIPDNVNERKKIISGVDFNVFYGVDEQRNLILGKRTKKIVSYTTVIKGFSLNIDLFYETERQKLILLKILENFEFCKVDEKERLIIKPSESVKEIPLSNE
ncbi:hypothetical protein ACOKFD_05220 [Flagellimonas sp. S174]|uniref:hypothetical protein n=1 Tax=Flagellimonas sp. S174 TaxID=3410790 RepID=UPI003BF47E70